MSGKNIVQDIFTSCGKAGMSMMLWKHTFGVSMVEIPGQEDKGIKVACLVIANELVKIADGLAPVSGGAGRDINGSQQNSSKFPWQVEWPALKNHQLQHW